MKNKICSYFSEYHDGIKKKALNLLSDLIKIKTINPGNENLKDYPFLKVCGEESKAIEILRQYLDKACLQYSVHETIKGRGNLIAKYGMGNVSLCVGCHLDIVPEGDLSAWRTDPFIMTEIDGFVFGRGTLDNKGPLVSSIMAMEVLQKLNIKLNGSFILAAIAGEEVHEKDGIDPGIGYLIKEGYLKPTYAIIPDIGFDMKKIDIAEKGRLVLKVISIGKQAHGSTPEKGINSVNNMARFISNVEKMKLSYRPHEFLIEPSVNLGIIKGGCAANSVPDYCEAIFDIRYLPGRTAQKIIDEFGVCTHDIINGNFKFEIDSDRPPHEISPISPLIKFIQSNTEEFLGIKPEVMGLGGGTFAKAFNLGGITAVGFGPGDENAFHVSNEFLEIKQMMQFAQLLACISVDILK